MKPLLMAAAAAGVGCAWPVVGQAQAQTLSASALADSPRQTKFRSRLGKAIVSSVEISRQEQPL